MCVTVNAPVNSIVYVEAFLVLIDCICQRERERERERERDTERERHLSHHV
jgi:hypothetical protein